MMKHKCSYTYSWPVITNMLIVGATETHFKLKKIITIESNLAKELILLHYLRSDNKGMLCQ